MEALACKEGLTLAAGWTASPSILESDCANIIKYLHQPECQRSASAFTIQAALEEARKLPSVVFLHTGREFNLVAHTLAQFEKGGLVQVVVLAACEPRGHKFERWPLHIARCVGKTSR